MIIPQEWIILLNVDTASLGTLEIRGTVKFDHNRAISKITAKNIWIRSGEILAGTKEIPFINKIEITLTGKQTDEYLAVSKDIEAGNKALVVTGILRLYG